MLQPIFSRNEDHEKIAFLNWRISDEEHILNFFNLGEGFIRSSIEVATLCVSSNEDKRGDIFIFPILSNVNHGIELYLKGFTLALNTLIGNGKQVEGRHNIKQIFQTIRGKVRTFKGNEGVKHFDNEMSELSSYIDELYAKIEATPKNDKMDFSRYPFSKDYENHFYVKEFQNVEVDLENFVSRFERIWQKLEEYGDYLYYHEIHGDQ
jgi:hypothetical protein